MSIHKKTLIASFGFLFGVYIGYAFYLSSEIAIACLAIALLQVGLMFFERKYNSRFYFSLFTLLCSVGVCAGILRVQFEETPPQFLCSPSCVFEARIIKTPEQKDTYQELILSPSEDTYERILLRTSLYPLYSIGDTVK